MLSVYWARAVSGTLSVIHASYFAMKSSQAGIPTLSPALVLVAVVVAGGVEPADALLLLEEVGALVLEFSALLQASSSKIDDMQKKKRIFLDMVPPVSGANVYLRSLVL